MITFKPVVYAHQQRKDGSYNVKIKVTFRRVSRHLPTNITAVKSDLDRSLHLKGGVLYHAMGLIRDMQKAVADLNMFALERMDIDDVVRYMKKKLTSSDFRLDFFEYGERFCSGIQKESSRLTYITALSAFERFLGERRIDINEITAQVLRRFVSFADSEPVYRYNPKEGKAVPSSSTKKTGAGCRYLRKLSFIFSSAKKEYNDEDSGVILIPRNPFQNVDANAGISEGQKNLGAEAIRKLAMAETSGVMERDAVDMFLLSFCLMGANVADLYEAEPPRDGVWTYYRRKTRERRADHAEMRVRVPAQARPYLDRLEAPGGRFWLRRMSNSSTALSYKLTQGLKRYCERTGTERFTMYAARHSWASIARSIGIEKATIDECLVHSGSLNMADIYIEKNWDLYAEANRRVLEHVFGKTE